MSWRDFPKIELHLHLEGGAPPAFIRGLAQEKSVDLSGIFREDGSYAYRDFDHFLQVYEAACTVLTSPEDFALQAKLMAAFVADPGYRPDGLALIRRYLPQQYAANDATPAAVLGRDAGGILANDDPRAQTPPLDHLLALDWDQLRRAISDSLVNGAIEIGVVGDIDEQAAIDAIAASFGALPERRAAFDPRSEARVREFAVDRSERTLIHKGPAEQAEIRVYWPARDDSDLAEAMRLNLLARVMQLMLTEELRERLGESYSPGAGASLSDEFPGYGHLFAASNVANRKPGDSCRPATKKSPAP